MDWQVYDSQLEILLEFAGIELRRVIDEYANQNIKMTTSQIYSWIM